MANKDDVQMSKLVLVLVVSEFNCHPFKYNSVVELTLQEGIDPKEQIIKKAKEEGFQADEIFAVISGTDVSNVFGF